MKVSPNFLQLIPKLPREQGNILLKNLDPEYLDLLFYILNKTFFSTSRTCCVSWSLVMFVSVLLLLLFCGSGNDPNKAAVCSGAACLITPQLTSDMWPCRPPPELLQPQLHACWPEERMTSLIQTRWVNNPCWVTDSQQWNPMIWSDKQIINVFWIWVTVTVAAAQLFIWTPDR